LVVAFAGGTILLLARDGVRLGADSPRYVDGAEHLLAGRWPEGLRWAYVGYIAVVAVVRSLGGDLPAVVGLHIGVAAIAGLGLWSLGMTLGGPLGGLVAAAFLLGNPDVLRWHAYILTDSLYTSAVVIGAWVTWRAAERGGLWYGAALLVLVPAGLLRPTGVLLLPVAGAFWAVRGVAARDWRRVTLGLATAAAAVTLTLTVAPFRAPAGRIPGRLLESGKVLYGNPAFQVEMPARSAPDGEGWSGAIRYVARHPGPSATVILRRVVVELAHVRPYYSWRHNLVIVTTLLPLYALAAAGIAATWRHPLTHLLLALIGAHLLLVGATLADYDGRFLLHFLGPIAALAGAGLAALTRRRAPTGGAAAPCNASAVTMDR
jgi:hypothetical protein